MGEPLGRGKPEIGEPQNGGQPVGCPVKKTSKSRFTLKAQTQKYRL